MMSRKLKREEKSLNQDQRRNPLRFPKKKEGRKKNSKFNTLDSMTMLKKLRRRKKK